MAALPPGRLTRKQIRDLACRKAGNATISDTDAVSYLQLILDSLYEEHPWPFLYRTAAFTVVSSTFPLPDDFLQSQDQSALLIRTFDGVAVSKTLDEVDRERFAMVAANEASGGTPDWWHPDRQAGSGLLFPDPTGHVLEMTLRYRALPASQLSADGALVTEPADVPVFPYHHYLVQALYAMVLYYEGDQRADGQLVVADEMLKRVLGSATPLRATKPVIPLDAEVFGNPFRGD